MLHPGMEPCKPCWYGHQQQVCTMSPCARVQCMLLIPAPAFGAEVPLGSTRGLPPARHWRCDLASCSAGVPAVNTEEYSQYKSVSAYASAFSAEL